MTRGSKLGECKGAGVMSKRKPWYDRHPIMAFVLLMCVAVIVFAGLRSVASELLFQTIPSLMRPWKMSWDMEGRVNSQLQRIFDAEHRLKKLEDALYPSEAVVYTMREAQDCTFEFTEQKSEFITLKEFEARSLHR